MVLIWFKIGLKWSKVGSKLVQNWFKMFKLVRNWFKIGSKLFQNWSIIRLKWSKVTKNGIKSGPKLVGTPV